MYRWFVLLVNLAWALHSTLGNSTDQQFQTVMQVVTKHCTGLYSPGCVQFEFLTQVDRVLSSTDYEVLPGVFLSRQNISDLALPSALTDSLGRDLETTTQAFNSLLAERLFQQLRTWTLSVYVFGNSTLEQLRGVMDLYLSDEKEVETGRKSKFWKYMGGAMLTVGFSIISALISKSLTISIIALALTLIGGANNFGFGFRAPAQAPIAYRSPPPVRSHMSHSSELQYVDDIPDDGGQPYVYVNRRAWRMARSDDDYGKYSYNHYYK